MCISVVARQKKIKIYFSASHDTSKLKLSSFISSTWPSSFEDYYLNKQVGFEQQAKKNKMWEW